MTANNYILIRKANDYYEVTHRDADTDEPMNGKVRRSKTALEALREANKMIYGELQGHLEYGIVFIDRT